jgi:MYXO-CTERM domain-containing protein
MRQPILLTSSLIASLSLASGAQAATLYVSPTGTATTGCDTRACPCSITAVGGLAVAGDTVIFMDGVYKSPLYVSNSGTPDAWITFKADECATPIIEGEGSGPMDDLQTSGVGSTTATYVRFVGLVTRGWNIGFGNGWISSDSTASNGHWEIEYCASYSNGRTGFTFFSAEGFKLKNSISAHNGSSSVHSWSSGVTLLQAKGSSNLVEGNVSFENMDAEKNSDGSGFIVDEYSDGATFINNIAFRNGGSCLRTTRSAGVKFLNNTCFHNAMNPTPTGPTNPSEVYFTDAESRVGVNVNNNVFIATGTGGGTNPIFGKPTSGWGANNVEATGSVNHFTSPEGTTADFTLASASTTLIGKGAAGTGVPTNDIGFDPKCTVKRTPVLVGAIAKGSWWQYDVDIDYIKSIGGVEKCFNPAMRSGTPDIGAYKNGAVTTKAPGSCTPPAVEPVMCPMDGTGGMAGTGGADATGGVPGVGGAMAAGGMPGSGGTGVAGGVSAAGGAPVGAGGLGTGGSVSTAGGAPATGGSGGAAGSVVSSGAGMASTGTGGTSSTGAGGTTAAGGSSPMSGGAGGTAGAGEEPSGCGCRVGGEPRDSRWLAALGAATLAVSLLRRRRSRRSAS